MDRYSGDAVAFEGGSFRENAAGKGLYHVMPVIGLKRLAQRYEYGQDKYEKSDAYKDGIPVSRSFDSAMRHLLDYLDGDNSEDHLAACVWNCFTIMEMEVKNTKWQDLPSRKRFKGKCSTYPRYQKPAPKEEPK